MTRMITITSLIVVLIASLGTTAVVAQTVEERVTVAYAGEIHQINGVRQNQVTYLSFSQLVEIVGGTLSWETVGHSITYVLPDNSFYFVVGSPFIKFGNEIANITYPAVLKNGQLYLPAETMVPFLDRAMAKQLSWDRETKKLRIDSKYFNVTDFSVEEKANGLLIQISLTKELPYEIMLTEGNWVNVFVTGGRLNKNQIMARKDKRFMYKLSTHQSGGSCQISFQMRKPLENWHHSFVSDPPRIQIAVSNVKPKEPEVVTAEPETPPPPKETETPEIPVKVGPDGKIDVIVIDPGHGGRDFGAVGRGKTREKDVNLGIAKELASLIRKDKQFKVVMTRNSDKYVSLAQRAKIANNAGADLFISIHANASPKRSVRGWNVFFLAPARNDSARAVAQFENSFFLRETNQLEAHREGLGDEEEDVDQVALILNEMIMTEFQTESHDFAMMIAREFHRSLKIPSRGVDHAGFFVLNKVFTPSVLLEAGFISNKAEEKKLKSSKYQEAVAKAVYKAIKKFKAQYESK